MYTKEELEKLIFSAQNAYYNASPILSDAEYDALLEELRDLDPENTLIKRVGAEVPTDSRLQKVAHVILMGSLFKVNTKDEFIKWAENKGKLVLQPKYDGISISLKFEDGKFIQATTRGGGDVGEDVTHNLKLVVTNLVLPMTGYLRGEVVLPKSTFEAHFADTHANPRNAASGITRRLDSAGAEHLVVKIYDVINEEIEFTTEKDKIDYINQLGFDTSDFKVVGVENAIKWYDYYAKEYRAKLDFEIDGLVFKMNDINAQQSLGEVDGRPKGQIAWKFAPEMKRTVLRDIVWQVGNTGRITPVAVFDAVKIGGSSITRASLHNVKRFQELNPFKNCTILVSKRGDVIPYVEEVLDV